MEFLNETPYVAQWTMAFDKDGRELLVVVVKGTFDIPESGGACRLSAAQVELTKADLFTGEPGLSAPLYETDFASMKARCDVLFNGLAHAPQRGRRDRVPVAVKVGSMVKQFVVTGPRQWHSGVLGARAGDPEPFDTTPFSYDTAFGGMDAAAAPDDPAPRCILENPVGRGYATSARALDGMAMPNTEEVGQSIDSPGTRYRPMALGPIGRNWSPRAGFAGTYDKAWQDHRAPYWPDDFDPRYFQSAPADQQIAYPEDGVDIKLLNLTHDGRCDFMLPVTALPILMQARGGHDEQVSAVVDTILIEPERRTVSATWRICYRLRRNCFEQRRVIVGGIPRVETRTTARGTKQHYRSLADVVKARWGR
jgi:hypothetical protein